MRPSRFRLFVAVAVPVAVAAAGVVAVTAHAAAAGCRVNYSVTNQWPGGFGVSVGVTNLGDPLNGWTLTWSFSAGQQVRDHWGAIITQSGAQVSAAMPPGTATWPPTAARALGSTVHGTTAPTQHRPASRSMAWSAPAGFSPRRVLRPGRPRARPPARAAALSLRTRWLHRCSMAENVAQGYVAVGGRRMWGPYGTGGLVVQAWTDPNSSAWQRFGQQSNRFGRPRAVWIQICIFAQNGATYDEVKRLIANARQHAATAATIYITGQPLYDPGQTCSLAGANGPQLTDSLARQAAADSTQNVIYPGVFRLRPNEVSDGCHANTAGQQSLGRQAIGYWGLGRLPRTRALLTGRNGVGGSGQWKAFVVPARRPGTP